MEVAVRVQEPRLRQDGAPERRDGSKAEEYVRLLRWEAEENLPEEIVAEIGNGGRVGHGWPVLV